MSRVTIKNEDIICFDGLPVARINTDEHPTTFLDDFIEAITEGEAQPNYRKVFERRIETAASPRLFTGNEILEILDDIESGTEK